MFSRNARRIKGQIRVNRADRAATHMSGCAHACLPACADTREGLPCQLSLLPLLPLFTLIKERGINRLWMNRG